MAVEWIQYQAQDGTVPTAQKMLVLICARSAQKGNWVVIAILKFLVLLLVFLCLISRGKEGKFFLIGEYPMTRRIFRHCSFSLPSSFTWYRSVNITVTTGLFDLHNLLTNVQSVLQGKCECGCSHKWTSPGTSVFQFYVFRGWRLSWTQQRQH